MPACPNPRAPPPIPSALIALLTAANGLGQIAGPPLVVWLCTSRWCGCVRCAAEAQGGEVPGPDVLQTPYQVAKAAAAPLVVDDEAARLTGVPGPAILMSLKPGPAAGADTAPAVPA